MYLGQFKTIEDKKEFLKKVYDYCDNHKWDVLKIEELSKELKTKPEQIRVWTTRYVKEYMGLTSEEIDSKLKEIKRLREEAQAENRLMFLSKPNELLLEKGIKSYKLWNNEQEKEDVLKYIYQYCQSTSYRVSLAEELGNKFGVSRNKIFRLAEMYAIKYLKMTEEQFEKQKNDLKQKNIIETRANKGINKLLKEILATDDDKDLIELIENSNHSMASIRRQLTNWHLGTEEEEETIKDRLSNYVVLKREKRKIQKQQEKENYKNSKLPEATDLVSRFIKTDSFSITSFCEAGNIEQKTFEKYVNIIAEKNPELFNEYTNKVDEMNSNRYATIVGNAKSIISKMKTGINLEDGTVRPFDVVDYYYSTKLSFDELLKITKYELSADETRTFKCFANRNQISDIWNINHIEQCYESKHFIGVTFDEQYKVIDPGREITLEEKQNVINYIKERSIPLCDTTYNCVLKRYTSGFLTFDNTKKSPKI